MNDKPLPKRETPLSGRQAGDAIAGGVRTDILHERRILVNQQARTR